jgi:hypothetical protein
MALGEQPRNERTSRRREPVAAGCRDTRSAARPHTSCWAARPAVLQEELCSCEQARAAPRATRSRPLVSPPCGCAQSGPGSTPLFHVAPPPLTPRGLLVKGCVSARVKGRRTFPRAERRRQSVDAAMYVCSEVLPSQKPGTSLSTALPDPPRACRSAQERCACKQARGGSVDTRSVPPANWGETHVSLRGVASRGTRTSPRQSPREGAVNRERGAAFQEMRGSSP